MRNFLLSMALLGSGIYISLEVGVPENVKFYFETRGKLTFFTFWSIYLSFAFAAIYIFLRILQFIFKALNKPDYCLIFIKNTTRSFFTTALCCTTFVTLGYWPMQIHDSYAFMPEFFKGKRLEKPLLMDLFHHFIPFLFVFLIWIRYPMDTSFSAYLLTLGIFCWYIILSDIKFIRTGEWPYAFMKNYSFKRANLAYALSLLAGAIIFLVFRLVESKRVPKRRILSKNNKRPRNTIRNTRKRD